MSMDKIELLFEILFRYMTVFQLQDSYFLFTQVTTFKDVIACSWYEYERCYAVCGFEPW